MRIAITGTGVFCPAGQDPSSLWRSAASASTFARALDFGGLAAIACPAPDPMETLDGIDRRVAAKADPMVRLALAAARQAWNAADLKTRTVDPRRIAVVAGTSRGPSGKWSDAFSLLADHHPIAPTLAATSTLASLSGALCQALGTRGPGQTISTTCASAAQAIIVGAMTLRSGLADVVIAGGSDAPLNPFVMAQLQAARLLANQGEPARACRPFDLNRNGLVPGEGAGFVVLENAETTPVPHLAHLSGFASATVPEAGRTGVPEDGSAITEILRSALAAAGLTPDTIAYVNAHGTGTRANDLAEATALATLFRATPCGSTKAVTGHCLGATPALELIIAIEALRHRTLPPSANFRTPDPALPTLTLLREATPAPDARHILSTSIGFWGNLAALVISR